MIQYNDKIHDDGLPRLVGRIYRHAVIAVLLAAGTLDAYAGEAFSPGHVSDREILSADSISARFLDYYAKLPQEKIYVHTDRAYYAAGDTVWFRSYVIDAASNRLSDRSKFVYLELLDNKADTLVSRIKIKADSLGIFANAMPLPDKLKSGPYTLSAYTQWMQNFGEDMYFKKLLKIVNPADSVVPESGRRIVNSIALDVMPEGGNLLAGHPQRVAYKAVGDDGLGIDVAVRLVNSSGKVLCEGVSQHLGMGVMMVNADEGEELWLEATDADGFTCRSKLPGAKTVGATLSVSQRNGSVLIKPYVTPSVDMKNIVLAIYGAGNLMVRELTDSSTMRISSANLNPGVVSIALIDRTSGRTFAERLIFVREADPVEVRVTTSAE